MVKFTVVLIYPDYMTNEYPFETYTAVVEALSCREAIEAAQKEAVAAQGNDPDDGPTVMDPEDFAAMVVIPGEVDIWLPNLGGDL
jgi:hypothetical protein